jgi:hypothetical protein
MAPFASFLLLIEDLLDTTSEKHQGLKDATFSCSISCAFKGIDENRSPAAGHFKGSTHLFPPKEIPFCWKCYLIFGGGLPEFR